MKKWLSILLCAMFLLSSVSIGVSALPETARELSFDAFAEQTTALIRDAAVCVQPQGGTYSAAKRFSNVAGSNYSEADFETARLIVCSEKRTLDTLGAVNYVSGFDDLHILQYETPAAAQSAYAYYAKQAYVDYVEPDRVRSLEETTEPASVDLTPQAATEEEIKQKLQATRTAIGADILQARLAENQITYTKTVTVAVIDTGVESEHPLLKGRVVATGKNFSSDKVGDSSEDNNGHGTHVAGIIVTNTLDNVVIQPYKVLNARGGGTDSQIMLGIYAAVEDGVQVINMSLGGYGYSQTVHKAIKSADQSGVITVVSAGNESLNLDNYYCSPASFPECITVMSHSAYKNLSNFSNYGSACDVAAPGENIYSSYYGGLYKTFSGTSMAAPFVSAAVTYILLQDPNATKEMICAELQKYATPMMSEKNTVQNPVCVNLSLYLRDAQQVSPLEPSVAPGTFTETGLLTLTCADASATIYYRDQVTTGGKWTKYTAPISLKFSTVVDAFAYCDGKLASEPFHAEYTRLFLNEEDKYSITDDGVITEYIGTDTEIVVPETVRGIPVREIGDKVFWQKHICGIVLPDTVTVIGEEAFFRCYSLRYVKADALTEIKRSAFFECKNLGSIESSALKTIGNSAFASCTKLNEIDFSKVETIGATAFSQTEAISAVIAPALHAVGEKAFYKSGITLLDCETIETIDNEAFSYCENLGSVYLPAVTQIQRNAFARAHTLTSFYAPSLKTVNAYAFDGCRAMKKFTFAELEQADEYAFSFCTSLTEFEAPKLQSLGADAFSMCESLAYIMLPSLTYAGKNAFSTARILTELCLPAMKDVPSDLFVSGSVRLLVLDNAVTISSLPENFNVAVPASAKIFVARNLAVNIYGTSGTSGAIWAALHTNSNFVQISQSTAIIEDVPAEYTDASQTLCALVVGFNRTYQWYANTEPSNTGGTAIAGATARNFDPMQYDPAPYYYCVVRSQDGNRTPVYIRTGVTANKTLPADYSRITAAKARIPKHLEYYSAETVAELQDVLDSINYTLPLSRQEEVNAYADALEQALAGLYALFLVGDINQDGKVNAVDARWALQYASGVRTFDSDQCKAADVNDDEKINAVDARWILQAASGTRVL